MFALLVAIHFCVWGVPSLPAPSPTPSVIAQEQQQYSDGKTPSANPDQEQIIRPITGNKSAKEQGGKRSEESTDNRIVWLTFVIALAAVAQVVAMLVQARHMRRGLNITKQAADAAKLSADAATKAVESAERALLLEAADVALQEIHISTGSTLNVTSIISFVMKNYGRTNASDVLISGFFDFGGTRRPIFRGPTVPVPIAADGVRTLTSEDLGAWLSPAAIAQINSLQIRFSYRLEVTYRDVFSEPREYYLSGTFSPMVAGFLFDEENRQRQPSGD